MSKYLHKSHDGRVLLYHLVLPAKYHRAIGDATVDKVLKDVCLEIDERYQLKFLKIGRDTHHVHFLVQAVPGYNVTTVATSIKSLTAKEIFPRAPQGQEQLWGGELWPDGYDASSVGKQANETMIGQYGKQQGETYQKLYVNHQLTLF